MVTEGELDAYLLSLFGIDAITVSTGSGSLHTLVNSGEIPHGVSLYVATDNDDAGDQAWEKLLAARSAKPTYRLRWSGGNDISDHLLSYSEEERYEKLKELFFNATKR